MIDLVKGQRINLEESLHFVGVGLGWKPNDGTGADFDLDASAFLLNANGKLLNDNYLVFYGNQTSPDGAVQSEGDNLVGGGNGDDETIKVDLQKVNPNVQEIIFTVTIYDATGRKQNFGQVHNAYIRIYNDENNNEIAHYDLDEDFSIETAVEFGRLYRKNDIWKFEAMGNGYKHGLARLVEKYGSNVTSNSKNL
ncbi:MAG: TerD family protein [Bacteroidales bacterium]|nr:TerD family protein [Bacteroidales bacterium]